MNDKPKQEKTLTASIGIADREKTKNENVAVLLVSYLKDNFNHDAINAMKEILKTHTVCYPVITTSIQQFNMAVNNGINYEKYKDEIKKECENEAIQKGKEWWAQVSDVFKEVEGNCRVIPIFSHELVEKNDKEYQEELQIIEKELENPYIKAIMNLSVREYCDRYNRQSPISLEIYESIKEHSLPLYSYDFLKHEAALFRLMASEDALSKLIDTSSSQFQKPPQPKRLLYPAKPSKILFYFLETRIRALYPEENSNLENEISILRWVVMRFKKCTLPNKSSIIKNPHSEVNGSSSSFFHHHNNNSEKIILETNSAFHFIFTLFDNMSENNKKLLLTQLSERQYYEPQSNNNLIQISKQNCIH